MKKLLAVLLVAVMIIPFAVVLSSAADPVNIAKNKTYTVTGGYPLTGAETYPDTGSKELTDGKATTVQADYGYANSTHPMWFGMNRLGKDCDNDGATANNIGTKVAKNNVTVNLGAVENNLVKFKAYVLHDFGVGILAPKNMEVFVSNSASGPFTSVGKVEFANFKRAYAGPTTNDSSGNVVEGSKQNGLYTVELSTAAKSGQYVKFVFEHSSAWVFLSEVEVYQGESSIVSDTSSTTPSEAPKVQETITVDGKFTDNGWTNATWTTVSGATNDCWQNIGEAEKSEFGYQYAVRTDDTKAYFGFKMNAKPTGTGTEFGNGKGSNIRVWILNKNSDSAVYNSFFDLQYKDGSIVLLARENGSKETNTPGSDIASTVASKFNIKMEEGTDFWNVEFSVLLGTLGVTDDCQMYFTVSHVDTVKQTKNNALFSPSYRTGSEEANKMNANAPYEAWNKTNAYKLDAEALALKEIEDTSDTSSDTSTTPVFDIGTPKENPNAVVTVKGPATYTAGQKINVTVTLESIKNTDGVGTVEFILSYDKNLLSADITDLNECEKKFATKLPNTDDWELMATSFEEGRYELSLLGTGTEGLKDSSKFEMTIPFTVKANATGALNIYVRHDEVSAKDMEYTALVVNGSLLTITKHVHTPGEWEITRAATKTVKGLKVKKCTVCGEVLETVEFDYDAPITGDAGVIALSILAVVAIAGTAIVIRKRG